MRSFLWWWLTESCKVVCSIEKRTLGIRGKVGSGNASAGGAAPGVAAPVDAGGDDVGRRVGVGAGSG